MNIGFSSEKFPLTIGQKALWFIEKMYPSEGIYNCFFALKINDEIDLTSFHKALQMLTDRHPVMRTIYKVENGIPLQMVLPKYDVDFQEVAFDESIQPFKALFYEESRIPFRLEKLPGFRWRIFTSQDKSRYLTLVMHHGVTDLCSFSTSLNDLSLYYSAIKNNCSFTLLPAAGTYYDFFKAQEQYIASREFRDDLDFWKSILGNSEQYLDIPTDFSRPKSVTSNADIHCFYPESDLLNQLSAFARKEKISPFILYLASFHILLHKLSNQNEVLVGTPTAGRKKEYAGVYGYFVNPITTRSVYTEDISLRSFLDVFRKHIGEALRHQRCPFSLVIDCLDLERDNSRAPLIQSSFIWENANQFENKNNPIFHLASNGCERWELDEISLERIPFKQQWDHFDLTLKMVNLPAGTYGILEYNKDLFSIQTIKRYSQYYLNILTSLASNIDANISGISLLSPNDYQTIVCDWNKTSSSFTPQDLAGKVALHAEKIPDNKAVIYHSDSISYQQLKHQSDRIALSLRLHKLDPESVIGVYLNKSIELITALIGILKAGLVYLPLDPEYPKERISYIINDAKPKYVITCRELKRKLQGHISPDNIVTHTELASVEEVDHLSFTPPRPNQLAYIIYTSGSTGKPKGTMIEHGGFANLLHAKRQIYNLQPSDTVLQFASINFDASISEISAALEAGATLCLANRTELIGENLISTLRSNDISWAVLPPAALASLDPSGLPRLSCLAVAGDTCSADLAKRWSEGRRFFNAYGPTETTIWATVAEVDGSGLRPPPIGKPIANTQTYILDEHLNPQPIGVPGELHIGGAGLARGYLNQPELTEEKFIANPFNTAEYSRLYKTGDLCRYLDDGSIEFLGRVDHQVKIRGFRIELGEIESILREIPVVVDALVMARDDLSVTEKQLVAYIVKREGEVVTNRELRNFLKPKLPDYMVPAAFMVLDAFPLTPNEKIDRKALPIPNMGERDKISNAHKAPRSALEKQIADVWKKVLGINEICITENFFDLGGHSLLLAQVQTQLPGYLRDKLSIVDLFKYPTIQSLAHYIQKDTEEDQIFIEPDHHAERIRIRMRYMEHMGQSQIAIVGMAGRFPGADNVEQFWQNILDKKEGFTTFSQEQLLNAGVPLELINDKNYVPVKGMLKSISGFEAPFFNFTPREAQITDPQQRLFLECAWEVLEDAGCAPSEYRGRIGVYAGIGMNQYLMNHLSTRQDLLDAVGDYPVMIGNDKDFLSSRVSYKLNLNGPAVVLQTACSTSLVAVHTASQALLSEECDAAIAGGVSFGRLGKTGYLYQDGMIMSKDGHCRAFDADATGTVQGQGCGVVLLKRLQDAIGERDHIYAIIKGTATNNDGSIKAGYTAPSAKGQAKAIRAAQAAANIKPHEITYVETHGTGTPIGDPIEIDALKQAFTNSGLDADPAALQKVPSGQYCAIGSVKSNIGHLDAASGIAGLIKTAKAIEQQRLPPSLNYRRANPKIDFFNSPFYVNTETKNWITEQNRYAGVSSFGIGGTNAHVVLTDPPTQDPPGQVRPWQLVTLSARTPTALDAMTERFAQHLKTRKNEDFSNICYTLHVGRTDFPHRRTLVCRNLGEAISTLSSPHSSQVHTSKYEDFPRKLVFMFPGQGCQYQNMGSLLYKIEPTFRKHVDECYDLLNEKFLFIFEHLSRDDFWSSDKINETYITPPALFIFEYSMAKMLLEWGIEPDIMVGHSFGEYVAACLAEVFTLEAALELVTIRGYLIHEQIREKGEMLSVKLSEEEALLLTHHDVCLAAVNGESRCVLSGASKAIQYLHRQLEEKGVENQILHISHASHSFMMEPILERYYDYVERRKPRAPKRPFVSSKTGKLITDEEAMSPAYWTAHLRDTVRFHQAIGTIFTDRATPEEAIIALEIGPGNILTTITKQHSAVKPQDWIKSTTRHALAEISDCEHLLHVMARLWEEGIKINWEQFHKHGSHYRTPLPTYPFERKKHWVRSISKTQNTLLESNLESNELENTYETALEPVNVVLPKNEVEKRIWEQWRRALGHGDFGIYEDFFDLGGDSLLAVSLMDKLQTIYKIPLAKHLLIQKPTISELASYIRNHTRSLDRHIDDTVHKSLNTDSETGPAAPITIPEDGNLVLIQQGNSHVTPLIMIHPIGGEVFFYRDLARYLDRNQPLYAFQAASLSGNAAPIHSIPQLAENYIAELHQLNIEPPYLLGGSSFGGLVAYEMAQQLKLAERPVNLLVMIDTPVPDKMPKNLVDSAAIIHYLMQDKVALSLDYLRELDVKAQLNYVLEQARLQDKGFELPPHLGVAMFNTWMAHQDAADNYEVQPYQDNIVFFHHTESMKDFPGSIHVPWETLVQGKGKLKVYKVPGNHLTMNYAPHVKTLVKHLKPLLKEAMERER